MTKVEEERKKEIARRNRELQAIQQKIEDKQKAVRELKAKSESRDGDNSGQDAFTPSKCSALCWSVVTNGAISLGGYRH